jgi:hypothetical protein
MCARHYPHSVLLAYLPACIVLQPCWHTARLHRTAIMGILPACIVLQSCRHTARLHRTAINNTACIVLQSCWHTARLHRTAIMGILPACIVLQSCRHTARLHRTAINNKENIIDIYSCATSRPGGEQISFKEHVERVKEVQNDIYCITGESCRCVLFSIYRDIDRRDC